MISKCLTCLTYRNCQPREAPIKPKIPDHPWTKCAVENLKTPQSETVINICKKVFSQFGIPKELITDSSSEFSSHKFRSFSKTRDILLITNQTV